MHVLEIFSFHLSNNLNLTIQLPKEKIKLQALLKHRKNNQKLKCVTIIYPAIDLSQLPTHTTATTTTTIKISSKRVYEGPLNVGVCLFVCVCILILCYFERMHKTLGFFVFLVCDSCLSIFAAVR